MKTIHWILLTLTVSASTLVGVTCLNEHRAEQARKAQPQTPPPPPPPPKPVAYIHWVNPLTGEYAKTVEASWTSFGSGYIRFNDMQGRSFVVYGSVVIEEPPK